MFYLTPCRRHNRLWSSLYFESQAFFKIIERPFAVDILIFLMTIGWIQDCRQIEVKVSIETSIFWQPKLQGLKHLCWQRYICITWWFISVRTWVSWVVIDKTRSVYSVYTWLYNILLHYCTLWIFMYNDVHKTSIISMINKETNSDKWTFY